MSTSGNVKWFDPKKGFGFIVGPNGQDVFVHYSNIRGDGFRSLKDGEPVQYELIEGEKGWQAREVQRSRQDRADRIERGPRSERTEHAEASSHHVTNKA